MRAIAESLCQRPSRFLLLATKDYKQLLLVSPQPTYDDDWKLKVKSKFLQIDLTNPTFQQLNTLEKIAVFNREIETIPQTQYQALKDSIFFQKKGKNNRNDVDILRLYLREIGKFKLLTAEEEFELGFQVTDLQKLEKIRKKLEQSLERKTLDDEWAKAAKLELPELKKCLLQGLKAKEKMIVSNLRLVVNIAKKYQNIGVEFLDLIQSGNLGLITAVEKFEPDKGYRFSTYAYWWIRQGITRAIYNHGRTIRLPVHLEGKIYQIKKTTRQLYKQKRRQPTKNEIATELELSVENLQDILYYAQPIKSLDAKIGSEEESTLGEFISSDGKTLGEKIEQTCLKEDIEKVLHCSLSKRERDVIKMRFGLDDGCENTLQQIGDKFNVSKERIRQIEEKALKKLRSQNIRSFLVDYLYSKKVNINREKHPIFEHIQSTSIKKNINVNPQTSTNNNFPQKLNQKGDLIATYILQKTALTQEIVGVISSNTDCINTNQNLLNYEKIDHKDNNLKVNKIRGYIQTMPNNYTDLQKQFESLQNSFYEFRNQLLKVAESLGVSPQPQWDKIVSISELESLLETVGKAEEKQSRIMQVRQEALTVLEKVLRLYHQNNNDFQPLVECQEKAQELKQQILGGEVDAETQVLTEKTRPFSQLLELISERESQDYQHLAELQAAVSTAFGMPLAMAILTGNILFQEKAKEEQKQIVESQSEDEDFVKIHSPEKVIPSKENAIAPPPIKDSLSQPTVEPIPQKAPVETATPLPSTEAPEEIEAEQSIDNYSPENIAPPPIEDSLSQPTVEVIPEKAPVETVTALPNIEVAEETVAKEEIETEAPIYNFSAEDTAEAIAKSIKNDTNEKNSTALRDLIWQLIREQQLSFAYHLASAVEQQYPTLDPHLPSWLIRALALSQHLRSQVGEIAYRLKYDFSSDSESLEISEKNQWNQAVMLLLAATALRPALLAPNTGASNILHQLRLRGLEEFYNYCQIVAKYGDQHLALEPSILKKATDRASWQKASDELHEKIEYWWSQAPQQDMIYGRAKKVWLQWLKPQELLHELLFPILQKDLSKLAILQEEVQRLSDNSQLDEEVARMDRQIYRYNSNTAIKGKSLLQLRTRVREIVYLVQEWIELQESRPGAKQKKDYIQNQAEQLRKQVWSCQEAVLKELDAWEQKKLPVFLLAGISCCRKAVEDIRHLFDPDIPLTMGNPNPRHILHAPLLKIPSFSMNEEWELDVFNTEERIERIVETIANGSGTWQQAFQERCQQQDHEATERIIEYLQVNPSESINIERLKQERERQISNCRNYLRGAIAQTSKQVENAVVSGLLRETERSDYVAQIENIENTIESTLRFSEKLDLLKNIDKVIQDKRLEETEEVRQKLNNLDLEPENYSYVRISKVLEQGDIFTANEYIDKVRDGRPLPPEETESGNTFKDFLDKYPDLKDEMDKALKSRRPKRELIDNVKKGRNIGVLQMPDGEQAQQASEMLKTWLSVKGKKQPEPEDIRKILLPLGFNIIKLDTKQTGQYTWINIETESIEDRNRCPLPAYGSDAKGHYPILPVRETTAEGILNAIGENFQGSPIIVLCFGQMSLEKRRNLACLCRQRLRTLIVIDDILMFYLCTQPGARLPVLFNCALPLTWLEPYTITFVPPEMFYGREREQSSIINPMESCFIYGGRQLGKTVLLRHVERTFHKPNEGKIALWIDLKSRGICYDKHIDEIWNLLAIEFKRLGVVPATKSVSVKASELLEQIKTWLEGDEKRRILLLLDEADRFLESDGKRSTDDSQGDFIRSARLKGLMDQTNRHFKVVFAGLHNVQRTTRLENHPLAHLGEAICIGPLLNNGEVREARALVERPLASLGYYFDSPELVTRILSQTNYYPSLIQLYCQQLLKHINNPDFVTFDQKTTPPYIITSEQVDEAYHNLDLRKEIRYRFMLTLGLDERYKVIAYVIAYNCLENKEGKADGFPVSWIREEVLTWWHKGFQGLSSDEMRVLLEEMVGLGVLRSTNEGRCFTLRNTTNVLRLMGTPEEIETALIEPRELPPEYEPATFRAPLKDAKNDPRRSPLTVQQESELRRSSNKVSIICGSSATGFDDLPVFLKSGFDNKFFRYLENCSNQTDFSKRLHSWIHNRNKYGTTLIVVSSSCSWTKDWIDEATQKVGRLISEERFVRIVFITNPQKAWQLVNQSLIWDWFKDITVSLKPWHDVALWQWLEDCSFPSKKQVREKITNVTGNWSFLLQKFYKLANSEPSRWQDALDNLEQQLKTTEFAKEVYLSMGFDDSQPQRQQVLKILAELEEASVEDLILLAEDKNISPEMIDKTLQWADLLSLATPVGSKKDGKNYWRVDPVVGRILQAIVIDRFVA
ncbi:MAG: sigma-70 family RNA polymerase sigma factor [Okeania sp. SIO3B5]|nr:sigma-70 family RNA polymerase sigma factor [Okeania sp. SIO3B5]